MNDPATIRKLMRLLASGKSIVLYPEGRVFDAPSVMKVYEVPALIAAKTGVAVIPVRLRYRRGWRRVCGCGARAGARRRGNRSRLPHAPGARH